VHVREGGVGERPRSHVVAGHVSLGARRARVADDVKGLAVLQLRLGQVRQLLQALLLVALAEAVPAVLDGKDEQYQPRAPASGARDDNIRTRARIGAFVGRFSLVRLVGVTC
jgi:hypothetical protein